MNTELKTFHPRFLPGFLSIAMATLVLTLMPARPLDADDPGACYVGISAGFCESCSDVGEILLDMPLTELKAGQGEQLRFYLDVPPFLDRLEFMLSGGVGDADLYIQSGTAPTFTSGDCGSAGGSNNETCWFDLPDAGTWYVMIDAHEAFYGARLEARSVLPASENSCVHPRSESSCVLPGSESSCRLK